jgi:diguanylate cyclase
VQGPVQVDKESAADSHGAASSPGSFSLELLIAACAFAAACISIHLTRVPGGIALFWPVSAIAGAWLIRVPLVVWPRMGILLLSATVLASLWIGHRPLPAAVVLSAVNLAEIALMVAAYRLVWKYPYPDVTLAQAAHMAAIFGVAIPGVSALAGAAILHPLLNKPFAELALAWWGSHTIGACLLGPPIVLFNLKGIRRLLRPAYLAENVLTFLGCLIGTYLLIRFIRFPFVSIGLLLLVCSFRLGGFGTSLLSLATGLLITNLWAFGVHPLGLEAKPMFGTLIGLPVIALLATVMPAISVGIGSDARRATARALKASEQHFRESMAHSPAGMLIAELDGIWRYTNLALQTMLGYSAEEFSAMPPGGPSDPEDWRTSESRWGRLVKGEISVYEVERRFRHKDGRWIWTHVAVSLLRDADGTPVNLIAQVESLEARRQAEAILAAERERLQITLRTITDAVITTDAYTRITFVNPAAMQLLGLKEITSLGPRFDEVIHLTDPATSKTASNLLAKCALHGDTQHRETPCILHRADGTVAHVRDTVSPVFDGGGQLTGMVLVLHDASADVQRTRELQSRAIHDSLTGLFNRAEFAQRLTSTFKRARALDASAVLLAFDLDRFKAVNDAAGHAAGDAILRRVAELCRIHVRGSDVVARLGGDEFAIILNNCSLERAITVGENLLRSLNPLEIQWNDSRQAVGASIGIAALAPDMQTEQQWLDAADAACYQAKRTGRGTLRVADEPQTEAAAAAKPA